MHILQRVSDDYYYYEIKKSQNYLEKFLIKYWSPNLRYFHLFSLSFSFYKYFLIHCIYLRYKT